MWIFRWRLPLFVKWNLDPFDAVQEGYSHRTGATFQHTSRKYTNYCIRVSSSDQSVTITICHIDQWQRFWWGQHELVIVCEWLTCKGRVILGSNPLQRCSHFTPDLLMAPSSACHYIISPRSQDGSCTQLSDNMTSKKSSGGTSTLLKARACVKARRGPVPQATDVAPSHTRHIQTVTYRIITCIP